MENLARRNFGLVHEEQEGLFKKIEEQAESSNEHITNSASNRPNTAAASRPATSRNYAVAWRR